MTRAEAEAAIGQQVWVKGGSYDGCTLRINGVTRKLVDLGIDRSGSFAVRLAPYRLHLIDEPKEE